MPILECVEPRQPVSRSAYVVTVRLESSPQHACELRLIIHHQYAWLIAHSYPAATGSEGSACSVGSSSPTGSMKTTRVPLPPVADSIQIFPPWASTIPLAIAKPIPVPDGWLVLMSPS